MNDLDKLKDLLFGAEKEALDSIAERVEHRETRASDIADVLPDAVHQAHQRDSELVESLTEPVGECLQKAFRDDPQTYSDALYPVIGPALRKSIAHTLKEFAQQINMAVEHSLTPKGLKWRVQAARAGISFGDFVLQKTLLYRIEQAYLISRENGLLIEHVHHAASKIKDSDAVSAMFTAIQDFVKESFSPDRTGRLESADMGEFTLWAVHGPHALLVCVIRGVPPVALRGELSAILERIHFRYGEAVRNYSGDTSSVPGVDIELEKCLGFQATQSQEKKKTRGSWPLIALGVAIVALLGYLWFKSWTDSNELRELTVALRETPGIYAAEVARDGDQVVVRGMRDPLAPSVATIAEELGLSGDSIIAEMTPFHSLESDIVRQRVEQSVGDLDTVQYKLSGSTVTVTGEASRQWVEAARTRMLTVAGVESVDVSAVVDISAVVDTSAAADRNLLRMSEEIESLSGTRFLFASGVALTPESEVALGQYSGKLSELASRAAQSNQVLNVTVIGSTDGSGSPEANARLAIHRAGVVATRLAESGVTVNETRRAALESQDGASIIDASRRSVTVELDLVPGSG